MTEGFLGNFPFVEGFLGFERSLEWEGFVAKMDDKEVLLTVEGFGVSEILEDFLVEKREERVFCWGPATAEASEEMALCRE